jgi:hypothetical protein
MPQHNEEYIKQQALECVKGFFDSLQDQEKTKLPEVITSDGNWICGYDKLILAVFRVDREEERRADEYIRKGWHPFPGFITSEDQGCAEGFPVAFRVAGKCGFYLSNQSSGSFVFSVSPGTSFTVVDHRHEVPSPSGELLSYTVALAFILGVQPDETWEEMEARLTELLQHTLNVWKTL